jgi:hypothetical protein
MGALGLLQSLAAIAASLTNWLHERQLIDLATQAAWSRKLEEVSNALDHARTARNDADLDADRHPERLHDDDGFRRD